MMHRWTPLLRQHAGTLDACCVPASRGCSGNETVSSNRMDAAQRLTFQAYHRDSDGSAEATKLLLRYND